MRKILCLFVVVALMLSFAVGCARETEPTPTPTPTPEDTEKDDQLGDQDPDNQEQSPDAGEEKPTAEGVADGDYIGQSDLDDRENYGIVRLKVEDERITEVTYEEYNQDNQLKSLENDYTYEEALESFDALPQELIDKQNVEEVDDFTGATGTSNKFRTAAMRALGGAEEKEEAEAEGDDEEVEDEEEAGED